MKEVIYIRADGNEQIGLGHLVRCMALGQMLKEDFTIHFVCKHAPGSIIKEINVAGFLFSKIKEEKEFLSFLRPLDIVVLDHYGLNRKFQIKIKKVGCKLICIDDLQDKEFYADLIINHAPGIKNSDYKAQEYTKFALGTDYALLRPAFLEAARTERIINKIDTAFICFGGADIYDLTLKSTKAFLEFTEFTEFNVVLGSAYEHTAIFALARENIKIKLHKSLDEIALCNLMKKCNIGIVPSSTILYELCCVKMPIISGYFVDNQKKVYDGFIEEFGVTGIDDFRSFDFKNLSTVIKTLISSINLYEQNLRLQNNFNGLSNINIKKMFQFDNILLRKATESDKKFVFNLSNESLVRSNSFDSSKIDWEQHKLWFSKQLIDRNVLLYIVEYNGISIGQVRFNLKVEFAVIGISIIKNYRGKGLSTKILSNALDEYFKENDRPIYAYIKKTNLPSVKTFRNVGFTYFKDDVINNSESFIYKKEKSENNRF